MYLIGTETGSNDASSSFDKQTPRHKCSGCGTIMPCHCVSSSSLDHVSSGG